MTKLIVVENV